MKVQKSPFYRFMESVRDRKTYFDELRGGNNGDTLILMGARQLLQKTGCKLVGSPENAEQIIVRGGGYMVDIYQSDFKRFVNYRTNYPDLPLIVGPSTYRFHNVNFRKVCEISSSPFILFARDNISAGVLREVGMPEHCDVRVSQDSAFELRDSDFIANLLNNATEKHVLIAMRKDKEGVAGVLVKMRGTWLPKKIRRPLSWIRDRMVARVSKDTISTILEHENVPNKLPIIYRDIAESLCFDEFVATIRDAALIVTNRLHVSVFGYLLNKRVILICSGDYHMHKLKGVYELSMSGPNSRTSLYVTDFRHTDGG
jgi:exopolysaccharide biosynthesis predicted pyruvyltransferase EpsI